MTCPIRSSAAQQPEDGGCPPGAAGNWARDQPRRTGCGSRGKPPRNPPTPGRDTLYRQLEGAHRAAAHSLAEGLEEALTLHHLGPMAELKDRFRTTRCLESINSQAGQRTARVQRWTTTAQRHRWLAAGWLDRAPGLRQVKGHQALPLRGRTLQERLNLRVAPPAA